MMSFFCSRSRTLQSLLEIGQQPAVAHELLEVVGNRFARVRLAGGAIFDSSCKVDLQIVPLKDLLSLSANHGRQAEVEAVPVEQPREGGRDERRHAQMAESFRRLF